MKDINDTGTNSKAEQIRLQNNQRNVKTANGPKKIPTSVQKLPTHSSKPATGK